MNKFDTIHNYVDCRENQYELVILGACHGVGFVKRGKDDNHLCFKFLVEDDENWFPMEYESSTWWFKELKELVVYVEQYMNTNYPVHKDGGGWALHD